MDLPISPQGLATASGSRSVFPSHAYLAFKSLFLTIGSHDLCAYSKLIDFP